MAPKPEQSKEKEKELTKEEEEALLKQREEEEYQRLVKERDKALALYRRHVETQIIREKQNEHTNEIWKQTLEIGGKYRKNFRDLLWWNRYLYEPERINCLIPQDVNKFISLWDQSVRSLSSVNKSIDVALQLVEDIYYTEFLFPDASKFVRSSWCEQITQIEDEIDQSLQMATLKVLLRAADILDMKTGNLQYFNIQSNCILLLWWNVTKNPKYRYHNYEDVGLSFELPKPMVAMECLLQLRYHDFDHLSHYCHTYLTKTKPYCEKAEEILPPPPVKMPTLSHLMLPEEKSEITATVEVEEEVEEIEEISSRVTHLSIPREPAPCDLDVIGVGDTCSTSLVVSLTNENEAEEDELLVGEVNLREFIVLKGVWHIELLHVPPQPVKAGKWRIYEDSEKELKPFPYTFIFNLSSSDKSYNPDDEFEAEKEAARRRTELEKLVLINAQIPKESVIWMDAHRNPTVARWDWINKCWTTRDLYDVNYDEETMTCSFRFSQFGTYAFLQQKFLAFPYQSWSLAPVGKDVVKMTVVTAVLSVEIQITKDDCTLLKLVYNEQLCLKKLCDKPMPPKILLKKLQESGVNLFPEHDSYKYIEQDIRTKDWHVEQQIYSGMALTCAGFEFASSRWNSSVGSRKAVFKLREQINTTLKGPQHLMLATLYEICVLKIIESSQEYSEEPALGQSYYANLHQLVYSAASSEARNIVQDCASPLIQNVYTLLLCVKPLSFCQ